MHCLQPESQSYGLNRSIFGSHTHIYTNRHDHMHNVNPAAHIRAQGNRHLNNLGLFCGLGSVDKTSGYSWAKIQFDRMDCFFQYRI